MDSNYSIERRKSTSLLADLPLEYRLINTPNAQGGLVFNVSEEGLLIRSIKEMAIGTFLNIIVLFPKGFQLANVKVLGQIVRKDLYFGEDWEGFEYGLKFIRVMDEDHQKLKKVLDGKSTLTNIS